MKPVYLKRQGLCKLCWHGIEKGTPAIREYFKTSHGYRLAHYHWECYKDGVDAKFAALPIPKRRGNKKSMFAKKRRALLSLQIYHRKRGNMVRVGQIQEEINILEGVKDEVTSA